LAQHIERLDTLKTIHNELWENYKRETNPTKKSNILMQISELQQYLSSYYDSTRYVMEKSIKDTKKDKNEQKENKSLPIV
jgi:isochorismate hydrolase